MSDQGSLRPFRRNVYSQNGEDGVIDEIFRRLGRSSGWFCEFGAWDGRYGSNSYSLLRKGWDGVMIEGDPQRYRRLDALGRRFAHLQTVQAMVSHLSSDRDTLDNILSRTGIPIEFDLLSIDVDGYDYQIWESSKRYDPAVVVIEINSSIRPGQKVLHSEGGSGSSFTAMLELGRRKGYSLVAHTGNMIFVKSGLVNRLQLPQRDLERPETLFVTEWMSPTRYAVLKRKLHFITAQRLAVKIDNFVKDALAWSDADGTPSMKAHGSERSVGRDQSNSAGGNDRRRAFRSIRNDGDGGRSNTQNVEGESS
jgi:hypothetical protein